jgi:hypothetical protein
MDLAEGHVASLEYLDKFKGFDVFNLDSVLGISVLELVLAFEKMCGIKINYRYAARRKGDLAAYYANTARANKILNWNSKRTLYDIVKSSWESNFTHRYFLVPPRVLENHRRLHRARHCRRHSLSLDNPQAVRAVGQGQRENHHIPDVQAFVAMVQHDTAGFPLGPEVKSQSKPPKSTSPATGIWSTPNPSRKKLPVLICSSRAFKPTCRCTKTSRTHWPAG